MQAHIEFIGGALILLSLLHVVFPKRFAWREQLARLSLINRQIMKVHSFFIALMVSLMGLLCLTSSDDLLHTSLGRRISLGIAIFWALRLGVQIFGYSKELWQGKRFETTVHVVATIAWTYFSTVFLLSALG